MSSWRGAAALLILLIALALLTACLSMSGEGSATPAPQSCAYLTLIPVEDGGAELLWPSPMYPIAAAGRHLVAELAMWNAIGGRGTCMLRIRREALVRCSVRGVVLRDPDVWVAGFPELYYGYKPWSGWSSGSLPELRLPQRVSELPRIVLYVEYSARHAPHLSMNVALDLWLTKQERPGVVSHGDAEVMLWLYRSGRARPAGFEIGYVEVSGRRWWVWVARNKGGWCMVTFVDAAPRSTASIRVELTEMLHIASELIGKVCGVPDPENLYLEDVELGTELGVVNGSVDAEVLFRRLELHVCR